MSGGELTVTVRGRGRGGPNQEYVLGLVAALRDLDCIAALAADTDGADGGGGSPTDPAGAFFDAASRGRWKAKTSIRTLISPTMPPLSSSRPAIS